MLDNFKSLPLSSYALITTNLIPLFGVLFFGWDAKLILALYWIENLIIGGFNVIKMLSSSAVNKKSAGLFATAFFMFHFGAFCVGHGILLSNILGYEQAVDAAMAGSKWPLFAELFQNGWAVLQVFIDKFSPAILFGAAMLGLSHLISFIEHFVLKGEIFEKEPSKLMAAPYAQIVVMHAGLLVGALLLTKLESPIWLVCVIVLFKMVVDYHQHRKRHSQRYLAEQQIKDI